MNRNIKNIAVLGSGVMGSRIACHFAGIGCNVLLLDIAPKELLETETAKNLTLDSPLVKNRIVNDALAAAVKSNPSPVYTKKVAAKIKTGNFTDNMKDIATADWIIEVVVENLDIKKIIFEQVEQFRKPGTLITSNTSGISINAMCSGRSDDFKKHFCGTHFFNPPRYLKLLEIIPAESTDPEVVDFLMHYGTVNLGKTTVLCKDTPAFIANRVGVFSIMAIFHIMEKLQLGIDDIDTLTGPLMGRPKSATFRTGDVVGLDTLVKVANNTYNDCPNDEARDIFKIPEYLTQMLNNKWLGDKTGQGFYKKTKTAEGKKEILTLNLKTLEYGPKIKTKFATLEALKPIEDLKTRLKASVKGTDVAAEFYKSFSYYLCSYVSHRVPEIANELYKVDDALKAGFGWEIGAFETWDTLGVAQTVTAMESAGHTVAQWVKDMLADGNNSFYKIENGKKLFYNQTTKTYQKIDGTESFIILENLSNNIVWKNAGCNLIDIGDGVLNLEWKTKMNTIGGEVLEGINKSIEIAEKNHSGLVIANEGANFSAGANIGMIFMLAAEQDYDELNFAVQAFQNAMMRVRYSKIPVVVAPHNMALGGGCEMTMHADKAIAHAESYIGLVELGVGLIPAGGGTKEFALRASNAFYEGDVEIPTLVNKFMTIAQAKVSTSAYEAFELGILRDGVDEVILNANLRIAKAKAAVLSMYQSGYTMPTQRTDIKVLGKTALGALYSGINGMYRGSYISEHDVKIAQKLAYVMCGGDLSEPTLVSEQYLLDLEREAFVSLCAEPKSLQRIQSILTTGKPLRN